MRMIRALSMMVTCLLMAVPVAMAVPKVGRLDGARAATLPAVIMPSMGGGDMLEEKLPDGQLAAFLAQNGDDAGAAVEWQRLAYDSKGDARARALLKGGEALVRHGDAAAATGVLRTGLAAASPEARGEFLYALAGVSPTAATTAITPDDTGAWADAARYRLAWQEAEQGTVTETYGLPAAEHLQATVARIEAMLAGRVSTAGWLSLALPGLGHAWLGEPWVSAAILPLWALALWLVLWHLRRRHHPYVVLWGLVAAFFWSSSAILAAEAAKTENRHLRAQALLGQAGADWPDLRLQDSEDGGAPVIPALQETLSGPATPDEATRTTHEEAVSPSGTVSGTVAPADKDSVKDSKAT